MLKSCALAALLALLLCVANPAPAKATNVAVVNTEKLFTQSTPGKEAATHLQKVHDVLRKGLEDAKAVYDESKPENRDLLREGALALEKQLILERNVLNQLLLQALEEAVKQWLAENKKYDMVISRQSILGATSSTDFTESVMKFMNKQTITLPALPSVTVTPPKAKAE